MFTPASEIESVGLLGAGVIGAGWAAHFLRLGFDVVAYDPAPEGPEAARQLVAAAWPTMENLGLAPGADPERLHFAPSLAAMAASVQVVQESGPENLETKIAAFAELDAAAAPDVVLLSSTSGLAMSDIQVRCRHPERTVVGHPFNPPYLIPLVEVVGGKETAPEALAWAGKFYRAGGKHVLELAREDPGFVANRLQEALWREALHMVAAGEASVAEIDAAITEGPGLRWAAMGPCLTFHLAGGEGGMAHMLDHFGPALEEPWTRLEAPKFSDELRRRMVEGCLDEAQGRGIGELTRQRDEAVLAILAAKKGTGTFSSGE